MSSISQSFSFMTSVFLKSTGQLLWRIPFSLTPSDVSLYLGYVFLTRIPEKHCYVLLSASYQKHMVSICLLSSDVSFHHLVNALSARILQCKVTTIFLSVINNYLVWGYTLRLCLYSSYFHSLVLKHPCIILAWIHFAMMAAKSWFF